MSNSQLINTYIDNIDDIYINSQSIISLLYDLINLQGKSNIDEINITSWNILKNANYNNISFNKNDNLINKKNYIKNFISNQFNKMCNGYQVEYDTCKCDFVAKTNFITLTIDYLLCLFKSSYSKKASNCLGYDINTFYKRIKNTNERISKSKDVTKIHELTNAFIRDFDIILSDNEGNKESMFSCLLSYVITVKHLKDLNKLKDLKKFNKKMTIMSGLLPAVIVTPFLVFGGTFFTVPRVLSFIASASSVSVIGSEIIGKATENNLNKSYKNKTENENILFIACSYIIIRCNNLITNININSNQDFDFDKI
ncbi:MAG: hypothetical protein ACI4WH_02910 [Oscillospiraceae bacterium]